MTTPAREHGCETCAQALARALRSGDINLVRLLRGTKEDKQHG